MAKAPAFQFYAKDWLADLSEHPLEIEGAWIRFCAKAWLDETKCSLSLTLEQWGRLFRCLPEDAGRILRYIGDEKIGEISAHSNAFSRGSNEKITIICRRMRDEESIKESGRLRAKRHYESRKDRDVSRDSNENLTSPSSSASASAKKEKEESSLRSDSCAEVKKSPPAPKPVPPPDTSKLVGTLPLANGTDFEVRQALVDKLSPLYPAVDVLAAFRSMKSWLIGHPKKLKTKRGIMAFITGWLDRAQNQGGNVPVAARASPAFPLTHRQEQTERFKGMAMALQTRGAGNGRDHEG
jgi:hypothetical protein